jgi:hypothetical protein
MRKARLALSMSLAAGGLVFACLALSAQSAVAGTGPSTVDLRAVATASHDAEALRTVVIAEKQIIVEGVQLVPQAAPLARRAERLLGQIGNAASAVILDAVDYDSLETTNDPSFQAFFLERMRQRIRFSLAWQADARGITPSLVRFFSPPASAPYAPVLRWLSRATVAPLKSMARAVFGLSDLP